MPAESVPPFDTWIATRVGPAKPVRFPGLQPALDWLAAGFPDPAEVAALSETARDCLRRFAHQSDLPITVERWPLSRDRRFSVALVSHAGGASQSLEIRLAPQLRGTRAPLLKGPGKTTAQR